MLDALIAFVKNLGSVGYLINIAGVILQYLILIFLYLFLYKLAKNIYRDLKAVKQSATKNFGSLTLKVVAAENLVGISLGELFRVDLNLNIGRSENNDVVIASPTVSAEHAIISFKKGNYLITDFGSTNGTLLNGEKLEGSAVIKIGDEIAIGPARFVVQGE
ncbi:MAG: FHA domain-containing protein [Negativicutes bacterium]|jgi:pSer/pThr/pTyr-binding forkhead associated (FHA) protein